MNLGCCLKLARQVGSARQILAPSSRVFQPTRGNKFLGGKSVNEISRLKKTKREEKRQERGGPLLLTIPVITFGLGCWQIKRLFWKREVVEEMESKLKEESIPLPMTEEGIAENEFTRVHVKGKFDHSGEMILINRNLVLNGAVSGGGIISSGAVGGSTSGVHVVTPFTLSDSGRKILVDRGWVPRGAIHPNKRPLGQINEEITLFGLIRHSEKRNKYLPDNEPENNRWYFRDINHMARLRNTMPIYLDADFTNTISGGPVGGQTQVNIRNEHLNYILTWFSISAVTGYFWYNLGKFRR